MVDKAEYPFVQAVPYLCCPAHLESQLSDSRILIGTDNMALVVSSLTKFCSREGVVNKLLRHCMNIIRTLNIVLRTECIQSENNTIPDRLSLVLDCSGRLVAEGRCFVQGFIF